MEPKDNPVGPWVGRTRDVRSQVTETADLKSTIAFQNDVNALLAAIAALDAPGPRLPSGVEAVFGILPGRATSRATIKKLRNARARLRAMMFPSLHKKAADLRPRPLRTAP